VTAAAGRGLKFTTAQATVAAAVLSLVSGAIGGVIQAWLNRDVEASKNLALIEVERLKANANITLEKQKQESNERLDRAKFETTLILKATESPNREEQIRNLKFFLKAGFINDPGNKIAQMDESELPSSPPPSITRASLLPLISTLPVSSPMRQLGRSIGLLTSVGPATTTSLEGFCTGWLIDTMHVVTADYCVGLDVRKNPGTLAIRFGYVSPSETGDLYSVTELTEFNEKVGYSILKISPAAGAKYGWLQLSCRPPQDGEELFIIEHAGKEQLLSNQNCSVIQPSATIPQKVGNKGFLHTCRSDYGSGGAPVVAKRDNTVLGIVHSASPDHKNELALSMIAIAEGSPVVGQITTSVEGSKLHR
jgi:hypothetical protein